jgi:energy-converting hydrogenase Eha subunit A
MRKLIRDCFTGPDGQTWAIGRLYSIPVVASGLAVPFYQIFQGHPVDFAGVGALLAGTAGAATILIRGNNPVDDPTHNPAAAALA